MRGDSKDATEICIDPTSSSHPGGSVLSQNADRDVEVPVENEEAMEDDSKDTKLGLKDNDYYSGVDKELLKGGCSKHRLLRFAKRFVQIGTFAFLCLLLLLWIGKEIQQKKTDQASDTLRFYQRQSVCGITHNITSGQVLIGTFESDVIARSTPNTIIAHCGNCGHCSNPQDVRIYAETTQSLYGDTVSCAKKALFSGKLGARHCMNKHVGFTSECTDCWVDNIACDLTKCLFVCMWHGMFNSISSKGDLHACTRCDERRCGADFVTCSGANRRLSGIISDINRDEDREVCTKTEPDWFFNDVIYDDWLRQRYSLPSSRL